MRIDFRQGIIKYPFTNNQQTFLIKQGSYVTLSTDNGIIDYTTIHGDQDYLFTETSNVPNAWGPFDPNTDYWLYFDINLLTGVRTFGSTKLIPFIGNGLTIGYQEVVFNNITLTTNTNITTTNFDFNINIDGTIHTFIIDGNNCSTFELLISEFNTKLDPYAYVEFNTENTSLKFISKTAGEHSLITLTYDSTVIMSLLTGFDYINQPVIGTDIPTTFIQDQHWFNTLTNKMNVYDGSKWNEVIRVFAAKLNNNTFTPLGSSYNILSYDGQLIPSNTNTPFAGSQVHITATDVIAGRILFDGNGKPIKKSNGAFFTTEDEFFINGSPVNSIKLESNVLRAIAREYIPKYHVVKYSDFDNINLAHYNDIQKNVLAIMVEDTSIDQVGTMCVEGVFYNTQWNWSTVGIPLWIDDTGAFTETNLFITDLINHPYEKPPVAWVLSPTSILFDQNFGGRIIHQTNTGNTIVATPTLSGISKLSVPAIDPSDPIVVGDNDPRLNPYIHPLTHTANIITTTPYGDITGTTLDIQLQQIIDSNSTLTDLLDVTINNPSVNNVLQYNGTEWVNSTITDLVGATNLTELTDVIITSPQNNQILQYVGTSWTNRTLTLINSLEDLSNVVINNPYLNQVLRYNGTTWVNATLPNIPYILDDLNDVIISVPSINQILQYNGTQWINTNLPNIDDLNNVNITTPILNQILQYNGTNWINSTILEIPDLLGHSGQYLTNNGTSLSWTTLTDLIGATILDELNDVIITNPLTNQVLQYNGTNWINNSLTDLIGATILDELNDVIITNPITNQILRYNGTNWINSYELPVYTLPISSNTTLGGIKIGSGLTIDGNGVVSTTYSTNGTVTSIDISGGTTGLTTSGGPIISSGTITLSGTLGITHGGTGHTTANDSLNALLPTQSTNVGKYLKTDGTNTFWSTVVGGSTTLTGLTDVNITTPISTQILRYNGTTWINANVEELPSQIGNSGKYLMTNGITASWSSITSGATNLDELTDVVITTPTINQILKYNGTNWVNSTETPTYTLPIASNTILGGIKVGANLTIDGNGVLSAIGSGTGTVTSIDIAGSTGLTINGSPIITSGTISLTLDASLQNLVGLGSTGFIKKSGTNTYTLDTSTYLTSNQNITLSGDISGSGSTSINVTLNTVPISKGGTGQTTATSAFNALVPSQTGNTGKYLTTDGTNTSWSTISSSATNLDELTDVILTSPTTDQILRFNGTNWVNSTETSGSYTLPIASATTLGGIKIGNNLTIDGSGVVSVNINSGSGIPGGTANTETNIIGDASDPFFNNVVLSLHMNGTNGSTTFTDVKGKTVTRFGNTQISTIQSKFGGASAKFDGSGDYLTIPHSTDLSFDGDFTIEMWIYPTITPSTGTYPRIFAKAEDVSGGLICFMDENRVVGFKVNGNLTASHQTPLTLNGWNHYAVCRQGSTITAFMNGVKSTSSQTLSGTIGGTNTLYIGRSLNGTVNNEFTGYLDDFRITKGIARYITNFSVPTVANYDIIPTTYDPYFNNTVLLLPMDGTLGSTSITDIKGKSVSVLGNAQISTAQSVFGGSSLLLDGTYTTNGEHISIPKSSDFDFKSGDFTIEMWVRLNAHNSLGTPLFSTSFTASPWYAIRSYINQTGSVTFVVSTDNGASQNNIITSSSSLINLNTWYHIAFVRFGTQIYIFVNGSQAAVGSISGSIYYDTRDPVTIGTDYATNGSEALRPYLNGYLDDIRVTKGIARYITNFSVPTNPNPIIGPSTNDPWFNHTILSLHMDGTNGSTTFTDVKGTTVSVFGNAQISTTQSVFGGSSGLFDGTGDYLSIPNSNNVDLDNKFTLESRVRFSVLPALNTTNPIIDRWDYTNNKRSYYLMLRNDAGTYKLEFYVSPDGTFASSVFINPTWTPTLNTWYHIAAVHTGTELLLFVNGTLLSSIATTISALNTDSPIYIGTGSPPTQYHNGNLDDLRITKGIARYVTNFTLPTSPNPDTFEASLSVTTGIGGSIQWNNNGDFGGDTNLIWDDVNNYLGINKSVPTQTVDVVGNIAATGTIIGSNINIDSLAPTQTGNSGKYLTTDGTNVSWANLTSGATTLDGLTDVNITTPTANDFLKFNGVEWINSTTSQSIATTASIGSVMVGDNLTIDSSGVLSFKGGSGIPAGTSISTAPGDPYYSMVELMLLMDGYNATTTFIDRSMSPKTVTVAGNAQISTDLSKFGGSSLKLDGTGDYLTVPDSSAWNFGTNDFTIECWYSPLALTGANAWRGLITQRNTSILDHAFTLFINQNNLGFGFAFTTDGITPIVHSFGSALTIGQWYHVAVSRIGATLYCAVNGVVVQKAGTASAVFDSSVPVSIGRIDSSGTTADSVNGYIDAVRITNGYARYTVDFDPNVQFHYNYIVSPPDIHFNNVVLLVKPTGNAGNTAIADSSSFSRTITNVGSTAVSRAYSKIGPASVSFNGTSQYLRCDSAIQSLVGLNTWTIELWVRHNSFPVNSTIFSVCSSNGASNRLILAYSYTSATNGGGISFAANSLNTWYHFALVRNGSSTIAVYRDGVLMGNHVVNAADEFTATDIFAIGQDFDSGPVASDYLNGYINNFRITKNVARYTAPFTPQLIDYTTVTSYPGVGSLQYNSANSFAGSNNLVWDSQNNRIGINTATPTQAVDVVGNITATGTITGSNININSLAPTQTGNSGKYLTTNGTSVSWANIPTDGKFKVITTIPTTSITSLVLLDKTVYRSAEYLIQITNGTEYQLTKLLAIHNGTTGYLTEIGNVMSSISLAVFSISIISNDMILSVTPTNSNTSFVIVGQALEL